MKTKLVACPNMKKRELNQAIIDGRRFTANEQNFDGRGFVIHWDDSFGNNPVREGTHPWNWRGFKYLHELVEQKWWEDPEMVGKPMKVRQHLKDIWTNDIFVGMLKGRYVGFFDNYQHAEPLTAADLYQEQV